MSKYAHVVKTAGHLINDSYIERLVKNNRHYIGAAACADGTIEVARFQATPTIDAIKQLQESFKDTTALIICGDVNHVTEESVQPYELLKNDEGKLIACVALDGDFDRHLVANESHVAEYQVTRKIIFKKIEKWYKNGGIEGVISELNDDMNKEDICLLWASRGSITFLFGTGDVVTISGGNTAEGKFSWGYASDCYKYMENVGEAHVQKTDKPPSLADKMLSTLKGVTSKTPAPAPAAVVSAATQPAKTETAVQPAAAKGILIKPDPKVYDTRKKLEDFYVTRIGHAPNGYKKDRPPLLETVDAKTGQKTYALADTKTLQALGHAVVVYSGEPQAQPQTEEPVQTQTTEAVNDKPKASGNMMLDLSSMGKGKTSVPQTKDTAPKHVSADNKGPTVSAQVRADALPILSPDTKSKVKDILFKKPQFLAVLSEDYKPIIDPREMRTMDAQLPKFMEGFGMKMENVENWPFENHRLLAQFALEQKDPNISAHFSFSLVRELIMLRNQNKHLVAQLRDQKKVAM